MQLIQQRQDHGHAFLVDLEIVDEVADQADPGDIRIIELAAGLPIVRRNDLSELDPPAQHVRLQQIDRVDDVLLAHHRQPPIVGRGL